MIPPKNLPKANKIDVVLHHVRTFRDSVKEDIEIYEKSLASYEKDFESSLIADDDAYQEISNDLLWYVAKHEVLDELVDYIEELLDDSE